MKIYVGNLSYSTTESDLRSAFEAYGAVDSVDVIMDRQTGRSKGFGFVEMSNRDEAQKVIQSLDGQSLNDRNLTVNEARPRQEGGSRMNRGGDSRRRY
ncbi:MAG: RNA-binding protein [Planctomycetia bacterium]|nr:RNA-binding protein [Planctomycetia bacterium]